MSNNTYVPLHPEVYIFSKEFLDDRLVSAIDSGNKEDILALLDPTILGVFKFPLFKPSFCTKLMEEFAWFENSGKADKGPRASNSKNRYGVGLKEFETFLNSLLDNYIKPIAQYIFEDVDSKFQNRYSFTARYAPNMDLKLKKHKDDSDITLNVCLGSVFTGSKLYFKGVMETKLNKIPKTFQSLQQQEHEMDHEIGQGVIHNGHHVHGARPITSGERINLIIWLSSKPSLRNW